VKALSNLVLLIGIFAASSAHAELVLKAGVYSGSNQTRNPCYFEIAICNETEGEPAVCGQWIVSAVVGGKHESMIVTPIHAIADAEHPDVLPKVLSAFKGTNDDAEIMQVELGSNNEPVKFVYFNNRADRKDNPIHIICSQLKITPRAAD